MGGAPRGGEGGASRGEAALAVSHSAARVGGAPLPCARHFLWGTFLPGFDSQIFLGIPDFLFGAPAIFDFFS